jgi:hypothetical protein
MLTMGASFSACGNRGPCCSLRVLTMPCRVAKCCLQSGAVCEDKEDCCFDQNCQGCVFASHWLASPRADALCIFVRTAMTSQSAALRRKMCARRARTYAVTTTCVARKTPCPGSSSAWSQLRCGSSHPLHACLTMPACMRVLPDDGKPRVLCACAFS